MGSSTERDSQDLHRFTDFIPFTGNTHYARTSISGMSIDRETFENSTEDDLQELSVPDRVLAFLAANDDRAFKAQEIATQTDLNDGAVSTALSRLKERELVEHKGTYWAITSETDRLHEYSGYERATALFNEQLGDEEKDAWKAHAPDEPHPSQANTQ